MNAVNVLLLLLLLLLLLSISACNARGYTRGKPVQGAPPYIKYIHSNIQIQKQQN